MACTCGGPDVNTLLPDGTVAHAVNCPERTPKRLAEPRCEIHPHIGADGLPIQTPNGTPWYICTDCNRTFTEAHPTIYAPICLRVVKP